MGCLLFILPFDASLLISRLLQDEVRGQTISSLVMLPRSTASIIYSKLAGSMLGLAPGCVALFIAVLGSGVLWQNWQMASVIVLMYLPSVFVFPHLTAIIALRVRWGAVPIAIGAMYAIQIVEGTIIAVLGMLLAFAGAPDFAMILMIGIPVINLALCVACHFDVLRQFRKLAEK